MPKFTLKASPPKRIVTPKPEGFSWDAWDDIQSGRRTCGDPTCPDPYCWMEYEDDDLDR